MKFGQFLAGLGKCTEPKTATPFDTAATTINKYQDLTNYIVAILNVDSVEIISNHNVISTKSSIPASTLKEDSYLKKSYRSKLSMKCRCPYSLKIVASAVGFESPPYWFPVEYSTTYTTTLKLKFQRSQSKARNESFSLIFHIELCKLFNRT